MHLGTRKEAILVFVLLAFIFAYFNHDPGWNGNSRLALTFAIVQEGRLEIDSFHDVILHTGDKAFYNGHYYSDKAMGLSLLGVIFYAPIYLLEKFLHFTIPLVNLKYLLTFLTVGLPSALTGMLIYILCKQVSGSALRAYLATLAITLGTMFFPFSVIFFSHQLAAALLFTAFFLVFQSKTHPAIRKSGYLFLFGFLLGFALITEYTIAPIILVLVVYYFFTILRLPSSRPIPALILPALGGLIPLAGLLAYNTAVFGSPLSLGYSYEVSEHFRQEMAQGFLGLSMPNLKVMFYLTLHPGMGLFWQSPVLLASLAGLWFMLLAKDNRHEAIAALAIFLSMVVIISGYYMWWGGVSFGPRHLVPLLPFLSLPLIFIPRRWFYAIIIPAIISIAQMFLVVLTKILVPDDFYYHIAEKSFFAFSSIYSHDLPLLLKGFLSPNLIQKLFDIQGWLTLLPLAVVIIAISLLFILQKPSLTPSPAAKS